MAKGTIREDAVERRISSKEALRKAKAEASKSTEKMIQVNSKTWVLPKPGKEKVCIELFAHITVEKLNGRHLNERQIHPKKVRKTKSYDKKRR